MGEWAGGVRVPLRRAPDAANPISSRLPSEAASRKASRPATSSAAQMKKPATPTETIRPAHPSAARALRFQAAQKYPASFRTPYLPRRSVQKPSEIFPRASSPVIVWLPNCQLVPACTAHQTPQPDMQAQRPRSTGNTENQINRRRVWSSIPKSPGGHQPVPTRKTFAPIACRTRMPVSRAAHKWVIGADHRHRRGMDAVLRRHRAFIPALDSPAHLIRDIQPTARREAGSNLSPLSPRETQDRESACRAPLTKPGVLPDSK